MSDTQHGTCSQQENGEPYQLISWGSCEWWLTNVIEKHSENFEWHREAS